MRRNYRIKTGLTTPILLIAVLVAASLESSLLECAHAQAQAGGGPAGAGAPGGNGAAGGGGTPAGNGSPANVSSGVPGAAATRPLTLADIVRVAVGNNSGIVAARQRLQKAQELIVQVKAQGRPQFHLDANDTYSSYRAFAPTLASPAVTNPTLPGGGQIPSVVDAGSAFSTAFIGGGGGGNAPASSAVPSTTSLGPATTTGVGTPGEGAAAGPNGGGAPGPNGGAAGGVAIPNGAGGAAPGTNGAGPVNGGAAGPTAPGNGGNAAPNGGGGAAGGGNAPTSDAAPGVPANGQGGEAGNGNAPGAPAPNAPAPGNGPATNAPAGGAAPAAGGQGMRDSLPPIVAAFTTDSAPPQSAQSQVPSPEERASAVPSPKDTTGGGTGTGTDIDSSNRTLGQQNNYAARASVSQYIDLFGLLSTAKRAQSDVRDFYGLDVERLQNETALAAKNLFFNALLAQDQVDTQTEQVRYATENVRITQDRLKEGIASRFDVLTAQAALSTAQQQLTAAQNQRDLSQADLAYLLGTDPDAALPLQAPALPPLNQPVDLQQSTRQALANRPEVHQASTTVQEAQRLVKLAGSTLLPTLGLVASAERTNAASQTAPESYANIAAVVAFPLDDGGATRSRVRSAKIDVQAQNLTLEQIKLGVALEVREATLSIRNAQAQVGSAQASVTQSNEALRLANERYQAGFGTFLDVLNALAQLARARTSLSQAQYFYQTSLAQLVRAMGGR